MTSDIDEVYDDFLAAASEAMASGRSDVLDSLDWWDLLSQLDDASSRLAVSAVFRAQGLKLASTSALGAVLAQPYAAATGLDLRTTVGAVVRQTRRRGEVAVVLGPVEGRSILVDGANGPVLVDASATELKPVTLPGQVLQHEVPSDGTPLEIDPALLEEVRARSTWLGRLALAGETLGAAEGAVKLSTEYAGTRHQFGAPIGSFQAVKHILAWASLDTVALSAAVRQAAIVDAESPAHYDEVVKALAGRNGRRACERALQVLGGIGFTAEHSHHHHHSRVLLLDGLLGSSAELTHTIGRRVRETAERPDLTRQALLATG